MSLRLLRTNPRVRRNSGSPQTFTWWAFKYPFELPLTWSTPVTSSRRLSGYGDSLQKFEEEAIFDLPQGQQCVLTLKHHYYQDFWGSGQKGDLVLDELTSHLHSRGRSRLVARLEGRDLTEDQARKVQAVLWKTAEAAGTPLPPPPPETSKWIPGREELGRALESGSLRLQWSDFNIGETSETKAGGGPLRVAARLGRLLDRDRPLPQFLMETRFLPVDGSPRGSDRLVLIEDTQNPRVLASASYQELNHQAAVDSHSIARAPQVFLEGAVRGDFSNEAGRPRIVGGSVRELVDLASGRAV